MSFDMGLYNCSRQFDLEDTVIEQIEGISQVCLKNEQVGFLARLSCEKEFVATVSKVADTCYKGIIGRYRLEIGGSLEEFFHVELMGFVKGDGGKVVSDPILRCQSRFAKENQQVFYISGMVPASFLKASGDLVLSLFYGEGYEDEILVWSKQVDIKLSSLILPSIRESKRVYVDLWQHPCNWARAYDLHYYSEEHFALIDRYLQSMADIGQRVCDLIISDYPWAGQRCYGVKDNFQDLFEFNIVKVSKDENGFDCDFYNLDRYIRLCQKHLMADEINLFGILGNWDAFSFGNPLKDLKDPIRVSYYDKRDGLMKFIDNKKDLTEYLALVFAHIKDLGLWEKTLVISDEPDNVELFQESVAMFRCALGSDDVKIKCAIHHQGFFDEYEENITSLSLNTCELVNVRDKVDEIREKVRGKGGKFTWYSCCFPTELNMFLKSPLIENRIKSWFTYYMNMDGFLRWAYGIWPGSPFEDASYKPEKWAAGDMFFVYPGKDMAPIESIRLKNFVYGLQDLMVLDMYEQAFGRENLVLKLEPLLGAKHQMDFIAEREVRLNYSLNYEDYVEFRNNLVAELESR